MCARPCRHDPVPGLSASTRLIWTLEHMLSQAPRWLNICTGGVRGNDDTPFPIVADQLILAVFHAGRFADQKMHHEPVALVTFFLPVRFAAFLCAVVIK